ncbi:hypothetical protein VP01_1645g3 [Puccinia sorghi]|uniref:Integrase catalytic domain-containing protein n=1 Tax=Puccinia sorghi TaxID=27349 RepID=A0A0L6VIH7_9BASI|nr:hypothetical protein VP01_1645g3 [Puccinia sorghi]
MNLEPNPKRKTGKPERKKRRNRTISCLSLPYGLNLKDNFECRACVLAKITKQPFKAQSTLASKPFKSLHLDLIGPINPGSSSKNRFILTVMDNHSGYLASFPLYSLVSLRRTARLVSFFLNPQ